MKVRNIFMSAFVFLLAAVNAGAQKDANMLPVETFMAEADGELNENWWGYFDGDYENISVIGLGSSVPSPVEYSCAIRIKAGNPELLGKRIKALKFAFERLDYIENVSVWMSKNLPYTPQDVDICRVDVENHLLKSFEKDNDVNIVSFPEFYQVRNEDIYVGYSFTVTSNEGDLCTYPIVVSYASTMENAFLMNWGDGWIDNAGRNYGNLAFMLLLDDGGEFIKGDANYDMKINVVDVSYTIDYILNGKGNIFNINGADIDGNGEINIVDVEAIIDMILERKTNATEEKKDNNDAVMAEVSDGAIALTLSSENDYRGFQMDIVLPEGADITAVEAADGVAKTHNLKYARISDCRYRIIASSVNGECIDAEKLLRINATTDDLKIENIVFATSDLKEKRFADISGDNVTSVEKVSCDKHSDDIYNVYGIKVNPDKLGKGVYIVNGRKIIIK